MKLVSCSSCLELSLLLQVAQAICLIGNPQNNSSLSHFYFDSFTTSLSIVLQVALLILHWGLFPDTSHFLPIAPLPTVPPPADSLTRIASTLNYSVILTTIDFGLRTLRLLVICTWEVEFLASVYHLLVLLDLLLYSTAWSWCVLQVRWKPSFGRDVVLKMKVTMGEIRSQVVLASVREVMEFNDPVSLPGMRMLLVPHIYGMITSCLHIALLLAMVIILLAQNHHDVDHTQSVSPLVLIAIDWVLSLIFMSMSPVIMWLEADHRLRRSGGFASFCILLVQACFKVGVAMLVCPKLDTRSGVIGKLVQAAIMTTTALYLITHVFVWLSRFTPLTDELCTEECAAWRQLLTTPGLNHGAPQLSSYPQRLILMVKSGIFASYLPYCCLLVMVEPIVAAALLHSPSDDSRVMAIRVIWVTTTIASLLSMSAAYTYCCHNPPFYASNSNPWFVTLYDVQKVVLMAMHTALGVVTLALLNLTFPVMTWDCWILFLSSLARICFVSCMLINEYIYSYVIRFLYPNTARSADFAHIPRRDYFHRILEHDGRRFEYTYTPHQLSFQQRLIFQLICISTHEGFRNTTMPTSHYDGFAPVRGLTRPKLVHAAEVGILTRQYGRVGWKRLQELNYEDRRMGLFLAYVARSAPPLPDRSNIFARIVDHDAYLLRIVLSYI